MQLEELSDKQISDITAEAPDVAERRSELEREIEMLEKGYEAFQQAEVTLG